MAKYGLVKRKAYEGDEVYYEVEGTYFFLSGDKKNVYLMSPHTADNNEFDVELYEAEGSGAMLNIIAQWGIGEFKKIADFIYRRACHGK